MMELSDGVMLLGESYGGKTKALKTLAASLQAAQGPNGKAPSCVILNPKAMKIDQLYGQIFYEKKKFREIDIFFVYFQNFFSVKSILVSRIFLAGWFDADEWKDGILATSFRTFASLPENVS